MHLWQFGTLLLALQVVVGNDDGLLIKTPAGPIQGKIVKLEDCLAPVRAFIGIPYAKPPIGIRRFQPPEELEPWTDVYSALREKSVCAQLNRPERNYEGNEDCLYLNIYSPQEISDPLPVLVLFHAGRFDSGSGRLHDYAPDYFLNTSQIVYVSINYRVGPLGYLSLGSSTASGNYGLKDQAKALKWIKSNIGSFGGNPERVILIGEEAGAIQAHTLLLAKPELAEGAISISGSVLSPWAYVAPSIARRRAFALGDRVGCKKDQDKNDLASDQLFIECLQRVDPKEIVTNARDLLDWQSVYGGTFVMTLESNDAKDPILLVEPEQLVQVAETTKPWMAGVVNNEGLPHVLDILVYKQVEYNLNKDPVKYLPLYLGIEYENLGAYITQLWLNYFGEKVDVSRNTIPEMEKLTGDALTLAGVAHSAIDLAAVGFPVYIYRFAFDRLRDRSIKIGYGVPQGADARILFPWVLDTKRFNCEPNQEIILKELLERMINFIKNGNPNSDETSNKDPSYWPSIASSAKEDYGVGFRFLNVDLKSEVKPGKEFFADRLKYWNVNLLGRPLTETLFNITIDDHDEL